MTTPERSLQQRRDALRRANEVRDYRARLKKDIKARRRSIDSLLLHPPEEIQTAKVIDLLLAVPKYGRVNVNRVLTRCRVSPSKTFGGLSDRQRIELVRRIREIDAARDEDRLRRQAAYQRERYRNRRRIAA